MASVTTTAEGPRPEKKKSFSLSSCISSICGSKKGNDLAKDVDISTSQKDAIFKYQLDFDNPKLLGPFAFYVGAIVESINLSPKVLDALRQQSILSPHPDDPTVYTGRITRQFTHQLPFLSLIAQRRLIALLFFWEDELARWTTLEKDTLEVEQAICDAEEAKAKCEAKEVQSHEDWQEHAVHQARIEHLAIQRQKIRVLRRMAPSMRGAGGSSRSRNSSNSALPPGYGSNGLHKTTSISIARGPGHMRTESFGSWTERPLAWREKTPAYATSPRISTV